MGATLKKQIAFYLEQSEPWQKPHKEVMEKWELAEEFGELCAVGLFGFERLKASLPTCNRSFQKALNLRDSFTSWYEATSTICAYACELDDEEFSVSNLPELLNALTEASGILSDLQETSVAIESIKNGTAKTLDEFLNEL